MAVVWLQFPLSALLFHGEEDGRDGEAKAVLASYCIASAGGVFMLWHLPDSQKPDRKKPWCSRCRAHTKFEGKTERVRISGDDGIVVVYNCRSCGGKMKIPLNTLTGIIAGVLFLIFAPVAFDLCVGYYMEDSAEKIIIMILVPLIFIITGFVCRKYIMQEWRFWQEWKKWTEDRE